MGIYDGRVTHSKSPIRLNRFLTSRSIWFYMASKYEKVKWPAISNWFIIYKIQDTPFSDVYFSLALIHLLYQINWFIVRIPTESIDPDHSIIKTHPVSIRTHSWPWLFCGVWGEHGAGRCWQSGRDSFLHFCGTSSIAGHKPCGSPTKVSVFLPVEGMPSLASAVWSL